MFTKVEPQAYQTEEPRGGGRDLEWLLDGTLCAPPRKPTGFAVESLAGMKRIREAYQTATDTWVGAD
jgi:hypothetical protein